MLVAANYAVVGPEGFQKDADGRISLAARLLLAPYLAGAFVNSRSWTRHEPKPVAIADGVWLGRIPLARESAGFATVVDLCAELPGATTAGTWRCIPMLDLVPPPPAQLRDAAASIEHGRSAGPVLVCCALGYSRSAATVATWLLTSNPAKTMTEAIDKVRLARPRIVIDTPMRAAIATAAERRA
jgi:protein-tyrosine phosphatase